MGSKKVLLVDDESLVRNMLKKVLQRWGYDVRDAEDCSRGEAAFQADRPDVCIVDYMMPDGSGLDLIRTLKTIDPTVPFILLTGYGMPGLETLALQAGAECLMTKPCQLPDLLAMIQRVAERADVSPV
ncbi:MAG TPA: response regulator [Blastocatellia bacterium]|nr:response regulator [Blastocatellia bacterium]